MAWRAGFSVRAHSSRRGAQLRSAATRAGSAENCIVKVVAFAWGSSRDSTTHAKLKGSSQDRKSTRLNSSHSQISYAVFCLKKKKNIIPLALHCMLLAYAPS